MKQVHMRWSRIGAAASAMAVGASLVVAGSTASAAVAPPAKSSSTPSVKVMTQNLYLGSDVGVAMKLLPTGVDKTAQFMWDQVTANDFTKRAPKLAAAAAARKPDVIGLQEATTWRCQKDATTKPVDIFNFTKSYLAETKKAGVEYVVAGAKGKKAFNPGFKIGPIVGLSVVKDPAVFQPLFGQDTASCGFEIGDALLVRKDLAHNVNAVGIKDYVAKHDAGYPPQFIDLTRGYAWANITINGSKIRFVTTHLESLWTKDKRTAASLQAEELAKNLSHLKKPVVVMGDFNSDPRDPRAAGKPNPGGQPEASKTCPAQPAKVTVKTSQAGCNSYWTMRKAGYVNASPDENDPLNFSWGTQSELAGPDADRIKASLKMGNKYGFTDRLDYVFVKNAAKLKSAGSTSMVGNVWPYSEDTWECGPNPVNPPLTVTQAQNTAAMSKVLADAGVIKKPVTDGSGICAPTDHAGLVTELVMKTTLKVSARAKAKELKVGKKAKVVRSVKTNGKIKKVTTNCYLGGKKLTGKTAKKACKVQIKVNKAHSNATVRVTPKCSVGLKVKSKVVAKSVGAPKKVWYRTWKVKKNPKVYCTVYGKG